MERVVKAFISELNESARGIFSEKMRSGGTVLAGGEEIDLGNRQAVADAVDRKTKAYMTTHKVSDYSVAMQSVLASEPELKTAYLSS